MPLTPHIEKHFTAGNLVRDIVITIPEVAPTELPSHRVRVYCDSSQKISVILF